KVEADFLHDCINSLTCEQASAQALSRSSLINILSKCLLKVISCSAFDRRANRLSSGSVDRYLKLTINSHMPRGRTKMARALSAKYFFRFTPPTTSTSKITCFPEAHIRVISLLRVP